MSGVPKRPTPDDLAGIPAMEEENPSPPPRKGKTWKERAPSMVPSVNVSQADRLAGTPVTIEGNEDLTIRPRKHGKQKRP